MSLILSRLFSSHVIKVISVDEEELEDARWYSRSEIAECLRIADEMPLSTETDARFNIPPRGTAAYALIRAWYDGST